MQSTQLVLAYFNETWIFSTYFFKNTHPKIHESIQQEPSCFMQLDGRMYKQMERHDGANCCFSQFCVHAWKLHFSGLQNVLKGYI